MRDLDLAGPISVTPAELKLLEALIALEEEEMRGATDSVTIYNSPDALALWGKVGKWAWKNRYKLLAAGQAVYDLFGVTAPSVGRVEDAEGVAVLLGDTSDASLDELLSAREQIYQAMREQRRGAKSPKDEVSGS